MEMLKDWLLKSFLLSTWEYIEVGNFPVQLLNTSNIKPLLPKSSREAIKQQAMSTIPPIIVELLLLVSRGEGTLHAVFFFMFFRLSRER